MDHVAEALLYAAARAQLVAEVIGPAIDAGKFVICDRFVDSSIVYQGHGRNLGAMVSAINAFAVRGRLPDATFLLKVPPCVSEARRDSSENDRIENEDRRYHEAVYQGYLTLERENPGRIVGIDGTKGIDEISRIVDEHVRGILARLASAGASAAAMPPAADG
jgi:dTMP kinase